MAFGAFSPRPTPFACPFASSSNTVSVWPLLIRRARLGLHVFDAVSQKRFSREGSRCRIVQPFHNDNGQLMFECNFSSMESHAGTISSPFSPGKLRTRTSTHVTEESLYHHQSLCQYLSTGCFWFIPPTLLLLCGPIPNVWNCVIDRGYLTTISEATRTRFTRIVRPL